MEIFGWKNREPASLNEGYIDPKSLRLSLATLCFLDRTRTYKLDFSNHRVTFQEDGLISQALPRTFQNIKSSIFGGYSGANSEALNDLVPFLIKEVRESVQCRQERLLSFVAFCGLHRLAKDYQNAGDLKTYSNIKSLLIKPFAEGFSGSLPH